MEENVMDDLFARIGQLEKQLLDKDKTIKELTAKLASATPSMQKIQSEDGVPSTESKKSIKSATAKFKTFVSNTIKFCHSVRGGISHIEFPVALSSQSSEISFLTRGLSTNSLIAKAIGKVAKITEKKAKLEAKILEEKELIIEAAKKEAEKVGDQYVETLTALQLDIKSSVLAIKNEIETGLLTENDTCRLYLVDNIDAENLQITLTQLKDSFGIALQERKSITKSINELSKMRAIVKSEVDNLLGSLDSSVITVQYQLIEIENNEMLCCPISISPPGLPIQDYEIKFTKAQNKITEIVNKSEGPVKFSTVQLSDDCGLIQASVIEVFTFEVSPHILNILHMHIDDMKEQIPLDAIYILPDQSTQDYEDWSKDALGIDLRYKVLVKSGKIEAILYNTGSTTEYIHFLERRVSVGDMLKYGEYIVEVVSVPSGLLTRDWQGAKSETDMIYSVKTPESQCSSRHPSDLPGIIEVRVVMVQGEIIESGLEIAVPVCKCQELSFQEKSDLKNCFAQSDDKKSLKLVSSVKTIEDLMRSYNFMEVKDNKAFLEELSQTVRFVKENIADDQELKNKWMSLIQQAERIMRNVAIDIRFNA